MVNNKIRSLPNPNIALFFLAATGVAFPSHAQDVPSESEISAVVRTNICTGFALNLETVYSSAVVANNLDFYDDWKKARYAGYLGSANSSEVYTTEDASDAFLNEIVYLDSRIVDLGYVRWDTIDAIAYCYTTLAEGYFDMEPSLLFQYWQNLSSSEEFATLDYSLPDTVSFDLGLCDRAEQDWSWTCPLPGN